METLFIVLGALLVVAGFAGSFLPVLPGPPLSYAGLLVLQFAAGYPFTLTFLLVWGLIVAVVMVLDNVVPAYGTKKFGGSPFGVWGSIIGLVAGAFFAPVGLVVGPLAGAFVGELVAGKQTDQALRSAAGSFFGFLAGTLLKVIVSGMMGYYFFTAL